MTGREHKIGVAVFHEQPIPRRGIVSALAEDPSMALVAEGDAVRVVTADVVVLSPRLLPSADVAAPVVLCGTPPASLTLDIDVVSVLTLGTLSEQQLVAAVYAASAGLRTVDQATVDQVLDDRSQVALSMLAEGNSTMEIAEVIGYSERTVKGIVIALEQQFGARNRAHLVAIVGRKGLL